MSHVMGLFSYPRSDYNQVPTGTVTIAVRIQDSG